MRNLDLQNITGCNEELRWLAQATVARSLLGGAGPQRLVMTTEIRLAALLAAAAAAELR